MANQTRRFEITPSVIDLGDRVVAVRQLVSAAREKGYPFRAAGIAVLIAALAAIGAEMVIGKGMTALKTGGSTLIWLALIAAGAGVFALIYQKRGLTLALSDGSKIRLAGGRDDFLAQVVSRIGEAIAAEPTAPLHYVIDVGAETIEILSAPELVEPLDGRPDAREPSAPAAHEPSHTLEPLRQPYGAGLDAPGARPPMTQAPAQTARPMQTRAPGTSAAGVPPGSQTGPPASLQERIAGAPWQNGQGPAHSGAFGYAAGNGVGVPGQAPSFGGYTNGGGSAAAPYAPRQPGVGAGNGPAGLSPHSIQSRELQALIALVTRSDIQHKPALLELLGVVDDHLKGGPTDRGDALAHWQSFAGYVEQYLADVDGLLGMTKRVGRHFSPAQAYPPTAAQ